MKSWFLIGTYTDPALFGMGEGYGGKAEGLYVCTLEKGQITVVDKIGIVNPSYAAIDEKRRRIYAVNELKSFQGEASGGLTEISWDAKGHFSIEGQWPTGGTDPCHVAVSPAGDFVCVANYSSGQVSAFKLDETGHVTGERSVFDHHGHGLHPTRQQGPHAHSIVFDDKGNMYAVDLGLDQMKRYLRQDGKYVPDEAGTIDMEPGSGPRSAAWDPLRLCLYVTNELGSSVKRLVQMEPGEILWDAETTATLPKGAEGENYCADVCVSPDNQTLYISNRGHDSIAVYRIWMDGIPEPMCWTPCGGRWPRSIAVDPRGKWLLAANQLSDNVAVFAVSKAGRLKQVGTAEIQTPVFVRFFKIK